MELHVTISLSDRLFELLEDKLPNLGTRVQSAITRTIGAQVRQESEVLVAVAASETSETSEASVAKSPKKDRAEVTEIKAAPKAAETAPKPGETPGAEVTLQDVRAAIERTRCRIEGDDYKTNPEGEGCRRWHKRLTEWFKATAALYGAEKPVGLPDSDSRRRFIAECDEVTVVGDELQTPAPY